MRPVEKNTILPIIMPKCHYWVILAGFVLIVKEPICQMNSQWNILNQKEQMEKRRHGITFEYPVVSVIPQKGTLKFMKRIIIGHILIILSETSSTLQVERSC